MADRFPSLEEFDSGGLSSSNSLPLTPYFSFVGEEEKA